MAQCRRPRNGTGATTDMYTGRAGSKWQAEARADGDAVGSTSPSRASTTLRSTYLLRERPRLTPRRGGGGGGVGASASPRNPKVGDSNT